MTQPKRPPAKPKPLGQHPHAGDLAVVVSFRAQVLLQDREGLRLSTERAITNHFAGVEDLTVHVREIGAGGEASEHEIWPPFGPLARTEDDVTVERAPLRETIDPTGDRL